MRSRYLFILFSFCFASSQAVAQSLPKVTGLALDGNQLTWDAQEGASGYNIHRDYEYFDTVRDTLTYTVVEPGAYHVISFNDAGEFGVTRTPEEGGQPYTNVEFAPDSIEVPPEAMTTLPKITGITLDGDVLSWNAQEGAAGYNIQRNYQYFDTVRGALSYTLNEPGEYTVVSFNDMGMFGVIREKEGPGREYVFVDYQGR